MKLIPIPKKPYLFRDTLTEVIYFRRVKKGFGDIKRSLDTKLIREAEERRDEVLRKYFNEKIKEDANVRRLVEDEWKEFLEIQKTKSPGTFASVEIQGRLHLMPFFGEFFTHEINEVVWEKYIAESRADAPKRKLFNDRKYFTMFMWFLQRQGKIPRVPKFRDSDPETKTGKIYSDDEIKRLLDNASEDLRTQILLGFMHGMRIGEIMSLEWDQIDLKRGAIHLPAEKTKIRKARGFAISEVVLKMLKDRRAKNPKGLAVFASPGNPDKTVGRTGNKRSWATCKRMAGVRGRFHDLRHSHLTRAFKVSSNPALVCHAAGLSLEEAQRTYLHFTVDDTRNVSGLVSFDMATLGVKSKSNGKLTETK